MLHVRLVRSWAISILALGLAARCALPSAVMLLLVDDPKLQITDVPSERRKLPGAYDMNVVPPSKVDVQAMVVARFAGLLPTGTPTKVVASDKEAKALLKKGLDGASADHVVKVRFGYVLKADALTGTHENTGAVRDMFFHTVTPAHPLSIEVTLYELKTSRGRVRSKRKFVATAGGVYNPGRPESWSVRSVAPQVAIKASMDMAFGNLARHKKWSGFLSKLQ